MESIRIHYLENFFIDEFIHSDTSRTLDSCNRTRDRTRNRIPSGGNLNIFISQSLTRGPERITGNRWSSPRLKLAPRLGLLLMHKRSSA
jgi:hypothetical protein